MKKAQPAGNSGLLVDGPGAPAGERSLTGIPRTANQNNFNQLLTKRTKSKK